MMRDILIQLYGALLRQWHVSRIEYLSHLLQYPSTALILLLQPTKIIRHFQIRKHLALLEKVIYTHNRVIEHEETLWQVQYILHVPPCLRLKVLDAVISDIANGTTDQRRHCETGDCSDAVFGEFCFEVGEGIFLAYAEVWTGGYDFVGAGADEGVAADGFSCGGGFEEKGEF